jgi:hypothetical protein
VAMSLFFDMVPRGLEWIWLIITKSTPNNEEPSTLDHQYSLLSMNVSHTQLLYILTHLGQPSLPYSYEHTHTN